jgi:hypothetical protein
MRAGLAIFYVLFGIPQVIAISSGIVEKFSLSWPEAGLLGLLIGYLPFVGAVAAIEGARVAWGWPWALGTLVFVWSIPLALLPIWIETLESNRSLGRLRTSSGHRGAMRYSKLLPDANTPKAGEPERGAGTHSLAASTTQHVSSPEAEDGRLAGAIAAVSSPQGAPSQPENAQPASSGQHATPSGRSSAEAAYDRLQTLARGIATQLEQFADDAGDHLGREEGRSTIEELVATAKNQPSQAFDLAVRYLLGGSKGKNVIVAFHLLHGAAQAGVRSAQFNLAVMYEHGEGVSRDTDAALEWYRQAASRSHVRAMSRLAEAHKQGELGVPVDPRREAEWLAKFVVATLADATPHRA